MKTTMISIRPAILCMIFAALFVLLPRAFVAQPQNRSSGNCAQKNLTTVRNLPPNNLLSVALSRGEIGDGIQKPWMSTLFSFGFKHVVGELSFKLSKDEFDLQINQMKLYREYYDPQSTFYEISARDSSKFKVLEFDLARALYSDATELIRGTQIDGPVCGTLYLNLLNDSCLPKLNAMPLLETKC